MAPSCDFSLWQAICDNFSELSCVRACARACAQTVEGDNLCYTTTHMHGGLYTIVH